MKPRYQKEARQAVLEALKSGELTKPIYCLRCGKQVKNLHAHHKSYESRFWLDVEWLCPSCHGKIHFAQFDDSLQAFILKQRDKKTKKSARYETKGNKKHTKARKQCLIFYERYLRPFLQDYRNSFEYRKDIAEQYVKLAKLAGLEQMNEEDTKQELIYLRQVIWEISWLNN